MGQTRRVSATPGGDAIIGATLEGLRRAAEEVEHVAAVAETLQRSLLPERLPELPGLGDLGPLRRRRRRCAGRRRLVRRDRAARRPGGDRDRRRGRPRPRRRRAHGASAERAARLRARGPAPVARARAHERLRARGLRRPDGDPHVRRRRSRRGAAATGHRRPSAGPGRSRPTGEAYFAEGPAGSPLGVVPFPSYEESTIPLVPGATVLLYTDGLVERPRRVARRGPRLAARLRRAGSTARPDELCGALLQERFRRHRAARRRRPARGQARAGPARSDRAHAARRARVASQMRRALGALAARGRAPATPRPTRRWWPPARPAPTRSLTPTRPARPPTSSRPFASRTASRSGFGTSAAGGRLARARRAGA